MDKTKEELRATADRWLDKAVTLEEQGKTDSMVNMALNKALDYEGQANAA